MTAVGVDGWSGRWVAASADGRRIGWQVHDTFIDLLGHHPHATVAVDMPIGVVAGRRAADLAAQAFLREHGAPGSSIFLTPDASAVAEFERGASHAEAMSARPTGTRCSVQAWNLIPGMLDVRDALHATGRTDVHEAHPECSFRLLAARAGVTIGADAKKTGRGVGLRLRALASVFDLDLADAPARVPVDDLLDACAVAWTAGRLRDGEQLSLPAGADDGPTIAV